MTKLILCAIIALSLTGCFRAADLGQLRREIERELPEIQYERQIEMSFGPMSVGFARLVTFFVPPSWRVRGMLSEIRTVKVGVYTARHTPFRQGLGMPPQIQELLAQKNWEVAIKVRQDGEVAWLLYRIRGQTIDQMHLIVLSDADLILVRFEGRLERLLARAVQYPRGLGTSRFAGWQGPHNLETSHFAGWQGQWDRGHRELLEWQIEGFVAQYNKVDGLYLGWRPRIPFNDFSRLVQYGELGRGLSSDYWHYQLGAEWLAVGRNRGPYVVRLGAELHDLTDTQDHWLLSTEENSLDAVLFRRDFRDYYRRTGFSAYTVQGLGTDLSLTVRYTQDDFSSLENSVQWALLGPLGPDRFRPNPAIDEERYKSLRAELRWDGRDSRHSPRRGWFVNGLGERAGGAWGGDRDFARYILDVRHYQPTSQGSRLDLRLRLGRATGSVPRQYLFDLGGFSSLRGYGFKEFSGDRMALFNAEHWMQGERVNVGFFADAGSAWLADEADLDLQVSGGLGLHRDYFRLYIARPVSNQTHDLDVSLRFSRTF